MSAPGQSAPQELPRRLGFGDSVSIVAGSLIGAGIFLVPNIIARQAPSATAMLSVWMLAGVLTIFGALAYAELGAMFPATGGQYVFLREAFGPLPAFLCGWAFFFIVFSGAVAWLAVTFSIYLSHFVPLSAVQASLTSVALIAALTAVNLQGVRAGATVQNVFTILKTAALAALVLSAFLAPSRPTPALAPQSDLTAVGYGAAMIAALMAYDGWVCLSFVAGEVKRPERTLPMALSAGIALCVLIYVLANAAYLRVLSVPEIAAAERVGTAAAERTIGAAGASAVTVAILVSIVGCANGFVLTAPRMYYAQARDGLFFRRFARLDQRSQSPTFSILAQGAWSCVLAVTGSYEALLNYAMFAVWAFYGLTVAGAMVLRRRRPEAHRPYRMWGYPWTALLFVAATVWLTVNTIFAAPTAALAGAGLIAAGVPAYYVWRRASRAGFTPERAPEKHPSGA